LRINCLSQSWVGRQVQLIDLTFSVAIGIQPKYGQFAVSKWEGLPLSRQI
jgi:hypothetical protein